MPVEFSEAQLAGEQEHDGADAGEAPVAAGRALGAHLRDELVEFGARGRRERRIEGVEGGVHISAQGPFVAVNCGALQEALLAYYFLRKYA